jgi:hypothetical protein
MLEDVAIHDINDPKRHLAVNSDGSINVNPSSSSSTTAVNDGTTPANKLKVNSDGSINVNPSSSSSSSAINDGTTTTQKATVDGSGNLHTLDANTGSIATNTSNTASNTSSINTATGAQADAAYTSGSGSLISIIKGVFGRLANLVTLAFDNTNALKTSIYGKNSAAGDTPLKVDSTGRPQNNIDQWAGAAPSQSNPVFTSQAVASGYVAAANGNANATTASTDYSFAWGGAGSVIVHHIMLQNNSGANLQWDLDTNTSAGSPVLATGQTLFLDVFTTVLHLRTSGAINVNGTSAANIVVRGWL